MIIIEQLLDELTPNAIMNALLKPMSFKEIGRLYDISGQAVYKRYRKFIKNKLIPDSFLRIPIKYLISEYGTIYIYAYSQKKDKVLTGYAGKKPNWVSIYKGDDSKGDYISVGIKCYGIRRRYRYPLKYFKSC